MKLFIEPGAPLCGVTAVRTKASLSWQRLTALSAKAFGAHGQMLIVLSEPPANGG
jgi:hypothetical protein